MNAEQQDTIYSEIDGDWNLNIVACGLSQDVDAMHVGWLYAWRRDDHAQNRVIGLTWDDARILVDIGQPLLAREVECLIAAGFLVDESFYPHGAS